MQAEQGASAEGQTHRVTALQVGTVPTGHARQQPRPLARGPLIRHLQLLFPVIHLSRPTQGSAACLILMLVKGSAGERIQEVVPITERAPLIWVAVGAAEEG